MKKCNKWTTNFFFQFSSNEDEKLLQYAEGWQTELSGKFPKREYKTTVIDMNGKSVFITRYFRSLKPPDEMAITESQKQDVSNLFYFLREREVTSSSPMTRGSQIVSIESIFANQGL